MSNLPIAVDLDGTLVKTDTLFEGILKLIRKSPLDVLAFPAWLAQSIPYFKHQVVKRAALDVASLPYNEKLLAWLGEQKAAGRQLILATGSDHVIAAAVAKHLGFFDDIMASDGKNNLSGGAKTKALVDRFGKHGYAYAGDRKADLPVWAAAGQCIVVNAPAQVVTKVKRLGSEVVMFQDPPASLTTYLRAIRVHQWVKNILIFAGIVLAHQVSNFPLLINSALAFAAFCIAASAIYIINDLLDLEADRRHSHKRHRPFASGQISVKWGMIVAPVLLLASAFLAWFLPHALWLVLAIYLLLTTTYSLYFETVPLLDVLLLAGLYTIRIFAGQAATGIFTSSWLLAFAMFFFLSLALTKRYSELVNASQQGKPVASGRGYLIQDYPLLALMGVASGFLSVLVGALYISSSDVTLLYEHPQLLWFILPLLLYWISRVWLLAHRGQMNEDPIVFAVRDKVSYLIGAGAVIILLLAI